MEKNMETEVKTKMEKNEKKQNSLFKSDKKSRRKTKIIIPNEKGVVFPEGTKVMINFSRIKNHSDFTKYSFAYKFFVEHNNKKIFTVEYEKNRDPMVVVLKEDITNPKWLFSVFDLSQVIYVNSDGSQ